MTTNSEVLLVCDSCNFKCSHIFCLEPPINYIPKGEWFCDFCVKSKNLVNKLEKPEAVVFPEYYQKVESFIVEQSKPKKKQKRTKTTKKREPIKSSESTEIIKESEEKSISSRKERAEKRRKLELAEKGSLSRRRRFRVRESKKKKKKCSTPKRRESKENSVMSEERRRSKRSSIKKCIEKMERGVSQLNERRPGGKITDQKKRVNGAILQNNSIKIFN